MFAHLARRHGVAVVCSDSPDWPRIEELTAGFVYARLHGAERKYASRYGDAALDGWATRIQCWQAGEQPADARRIANWMPPRRTCRDVYVLFDK